MKRSLWIGGILFAVAFNAAAVNFPAPDHLFYDGPGVFTPADRAQFLAIQSSLEKATGAQIAVAIIPSLEGLTVEDYAVQLFSKWGVGMKEMNNGVLLLVALNDRKMRIEVGYGLEASLPDGLCGEIIREQMRPSFKAGRYAAGTLAAARRISGILTGQQTDEDRDLVTIQGDMPLFIVIPFFSIFVLIGAFMLGAGVGSKTIFPVFFGLFFGGMPSLMAVGLLYEMHKRGLWLMLFPVMYVLMVLWSYRKTRNSPTLLKSMQGTSSTSYGGWTFGGSGGSGSGSGGGGGGGGSSGGGGASGSW